MSAKKQAVMQPWLDAWATANNINADFSTLVDFPADARSELVAAFNENLVPTKFKSKCGAGWCSNTQAFSYTRTCSSFAVTRELLEPLQEPMTGTSKRIKLGGGMRGHSTSTGGFSALLAATSTTPTIPAKLAITPGVGTGAPGFRPCKTELRWLLHVIQRVHAWWCVTG